MHREIHQWYSPRLNKNMDIAVYGHYGFALLLIPTAAADFLEYERFQLLKAIEKPINEGKVKVFSINSINMESWLNKSMEPRHKAIRHQQFNEYVFQEVIPFIQDKTSLESPIITCGASFGALHALNMFLKRPDLLKGAIAMSGSYDLSYYTNDYWDENVYFNSPMHYLKNLQDENILHQIRGAKKILISSGSGAWERPQFSRQISAVLAEKGINHELDIWGNDMPHDWQTWRAMLPYYLATKF
jgi:esterase/lipase superfamily enzyme